MTMRNIFFTIAMSITLSLPWRRQVSGCPALSRLPTWLERLRPRRI
jgi:hypothetical protein